MHTVDIRLYRIFKDKFHLPEEEAEEVAQTLEDMFEARTDIKNTRMVEIIQRDIQSLRKDLQTEMQSLRVHMDEKFASVDERFATKADLQRTRADLITWMFLFWVGQVATTLGVIFLFLKK